MSHFSVLCAGDVDYQMAPFHEFECDGRDDEFIQTIDITEDKKRDYEEAIESYKAKKAKVDAGEADAETLKYEFDGDGFREYIEDYCEYPIVENEKDLDIKKTHKHSYAIFEPGKQPKVFRRTNPNKFYDYYMEGYNGLLLKNGDWVNVARKGDVDFESLWNKAVNDYKSQYQNVVTRLGGRPIVKHKWSDLIEKFGDRKMAQEEYYKQDIVNKFDKLRKKNIVGIFENVENYDCTEEEFVAKNTPHTITFGIVKDRKYYSHGDMGWWAMVSNKKEPNVWDEEYKNIIESIGDDEIITILDCHI